METETALKIYVLDPLIMVLDEKNSILLPTEDKKVEVSIEIKKSLIFFLQGA